MSNSPSDIILKQALIQFRQFGFKHVTMDELAKQVGMSKKTVYEQFKDKEELVFACVKNMIEDQEVVVRQIFEAKVNAIEKLFNILKFMEAMVRGMNPVCHIEMQRFYPKSHDYLHNHKQRFILESLKENLVQGIQEGLYREKLHIDIIAKYRLEATFVIFQNNIFPIDQYDIVEVNRHLFEHYLYGISTPKGQKLISKYFS